MVEAVALQASLFIFLMGKLIPRVCGRRPNAHTQNQSLVLSQILSFADAITLGKKYSF